MDAQTERVKLAIVGGGIGGLTLANCIAKFIPDFDSLFEINVYESTGSLKAQVGAGIGIWPHAWIVLEALGLDKEIAKLTLSPITEDPSDLFLMRIADRDEGQDLFRITTSGGHSVSCHRADFQALLLNTIPASIKIHTKKRLASFTQNEDGVELRFEDGTIADAHFVIGADGLQSRVRKGIIQELLQEGAPAETARLADPIWTGYMIYRTLVRRENLVAAGWENHSALKEWTLWSGKHNASIMTYPIRNGELIMFNGVRSWPEYQGTPFSQEVFDEILNKEGFTRKDVVAAADASKSNETDPWADNGGGGRIGVGRSKWVSVADADEVMNSYSGWEPEVQALVKGIDTALAWAVHAIGPLDSFVKGKVCLLGDAAHAMHPHQGAGAGQAIIDAYILAKALAAAASTNPAELISHISDVLEAYDVIRRPAIAYIAESSRDNSIRYNHRVEEKNEAGEKTWRFIDSQNPADVQLLKQQMHDRWSYAWDKAATRGDAERVEQMVKERMGL